MYIINDYTMNGNNTHNMPILQIQKHSNILIVTENKKTLIFRLHKNFCIQKVFLFFSEKKDFFFFLANLCSFFNLAIFHKIRLFGPAIVRYSGTFGIYISLHLSAFLIIVPFNVKTVY